MSYFDTLPKYIREAKYSERVNSDRALRALEAVLPAGAHVKVVDQRDRDLIVSVAGRRLRLRWLPVGWPQQVEEALQRRPRPDIVAAPRLSPGARHKASHQEVGWVDESGAAEIASGSLLISRTGDPVVPLDARLGWRPATLAVCEVLLAGHPATVSAVVGCTGLAVSTVAESLKFLGSQGFLGANAARGPLSHRYIADEGTLMDAYAAAAARMQTPVSIRVGVLWRDPVKGAIETGRSWKDSGTDWAVTGALSASVLAPFQTEIAPMEIYLAAKTYGDLRLAAVTAGLRELEGGRLVLRPFPTPANGTVAFEPRRGLTSVLWPRVYADLRKAGVRGEEAADHLRQEMHRVRP